MHQQALYAKECEHEEAMAKLSEERQKTIDAKRALFEAAEAEHEAAMKAANEEHMLDIAAMQSEHEKAMEKVRRHQIAPNAKEASHQLAITTTESAHNERIGSMSNELDMIRTELTNEITRQVEAAVAKEKEAAEREMAEQLEVLEATRTAAVKELAEGGGEGALNTQLLAAQKAAEEGAVAMRAELDAERQRWKAEAAEASSQHSVLKKALEEAEAASEAMKMSAVQQRSEAVAEAARALEEAEIAKAEAAAANDALAAEKEAALEEAAEHTAALLEQATCAQGRWRRGWPPRLRS